MKIGDLVKSKPRPVSRHALIGIIIQVREGAYENQPLVQVYWPHHRDEGWVDAKDMEIINESR